MNIVSQPTFRTCLASSVDMLRAAQALRYRVFVEELGGGGAQVDHAAGLEQDAFDAHCDHLLLIDDSIDQVVGVYRLIRDTHAAALGRFYSEDEYDIAGLRQSGKRLLELGRSCLHPEYRGGMAMYHLWSGLASYIDEHETEVLFGVASFHGTDADALAEQLSLLHHHYRAPEGLCPVARAPHAVEMNRIPADEIDRKAAMRGMPALIKGYLRFGGRVGAGAWVDHAFNTTDVCLVMDTAEMNPRQRQIYSATP